MFLTNENDQGGEKLRENKTNFKKILQKFETNFFKKYSVEI